MKFLKYAGSFTLVLLLILFTNNAFGQGQGKGKGKGLVENRGIQNGQGFTTGQGHLTGKSAVDLPEPEPNCVDEAIAIWLARDPFIISIEPNDDTSFFIIEQFGVCPSCACFKLTIITGQNDRGSCFWRLTAVVPVSCPGDGGGGADE